MAPLLRRVYDQMSEPRYLHIYAVFHVFHNAIINFSCAGFLIMLFGWRLYSLFHNIFPSLEFNKASSRYVVYRLGKNFYLAGLSPWALARMVAVTIITPTLWYEAATESSRLLLI